MRLKKKTFKHYSGKVYDLTISNSHTYNVEGLAVHNSAGGSLVAYVLDIIQIDPIRFNLQFERFLRSDATDMPDIDTDFENPMEFKEYLQREWGEDNVVPISNWNTLQLRSLIKDVSKFYDIPFAEVNAVTSKMLGEATPQAKKKHGITAGVYNPTFEEICEYSQTLQRFFEKYPDVKTHVLELHGQVRSCFSEDTFILTDKGYKLPLEIDKEDRVAYLSVDGSIEYNDNWELLYQGKKELFRVELDDGSVLELTSDHEVMTQDGYKKVEELKENDVFIGV